MAEGFYFSNADATMVFWRAIRMFNINDEKGRIKLLRKCVARQRAKYIRDPQTFLNGKLVKKINSPKDITNG